MHIIEMKLCFRYTGTQTEVINIGSYNYLGFSQNYGPCASQASETIDCEGISLCSTVQELGNLIYLYVILCYLYST